MILLYTKEEIEHEISDYGNPEDIINSFGKMNKGEQYSIYLSLVANGEIHQTQELMHKTYSVEDEISKHIEELKNNESSSEDN